MVTGMRSGRSGSTAIDGRWHSFGGRSIPISRGMGNFALSHTGGNRFVGNGFALRSRGFGRFGHGFRHGFGCFDCDFDFDDFDFGFFGPGWGWGWPFWGWGFGWGWPGYWSLGWGYPGWGNPYDDYDNAWVWDNSNTGNYSDYTGDTNSNYSDDSVYSNAPNNNNYNDDDEQAQQDASQPNSTNPVDPASVATVVYLKDGTRLQMTTYWSSGNTLHYVNGQGVVSTLDISQIDLQRTVNENAKHGVRFSIKPQTNTTTPSAPTVQPTVLSKTA